MIDVERWAIKDRLTDKLVIAKWGRTLWKRKPHPKNVNILGYRHWEKGSDYLTPIKVRVQEIEDE